MRHRREPRTRVLAWIAVAALLAAGPPALHAGETAYLVKDINQATHDSGSNPGGYQVVNGHVLFVTQRYPSSLHATDGQTGAVITLAANLENNGPALGGWKYYTTFTYDPDPPYSYSTTLSATDGTLQGRIAMKTVQNANLSILYSTVGGRLLFIVDAYDDSTGQSSRELWSAEGTQTELLTAFEPNSWGFNVQGEVGGRLVFTWSDGQGRPQLWATDGTAAGTEAIGPQDAGAWAFRGLGGRLLLNVFREDTSTNELWATDGTAPGTALLMTSRPERSLLIPEDPVDASGRLFFLAGAFGIADDEMWVTDGTQAGTSLLMQPPPGEQLTFNMRQAQGQTFFVTFIEEPLSVTLWRSDGTVAGTIPLKTGEYFSVANSMTHGSLLIFRGQDTAAGIELWSSDGTVDGTVLIQDISPGADETDPENPVPSSSNPRNFLRLGGAVYFLADAAAGAPQIWTSDGTAGGTLPVATSLPPLNYGSYLSYFTLGDTALFTASDNRELWQFAPGGPSALTRLADAGEGGAIIDPYTNPGSLMSSSVHSLGGRLLFLACDAQHGWKLWASDGSEDGAAPLETTPDASASCSAYSPPQFLTEVGGTLFYAGTESARGKELHRTDATAAGSSIVKDIFPGPASGLSGYSLEFAVHGGRLIFTGNTPDSGPEPWISDGTEAGTRMIQDLQLGNDSSNYSLNAAALGDRLVFSADDGIHYTEPWISNGSAAGTRMLANLVPEGALGGGYHDWDCGSSPQSLIALGDLILFGARYLAGDCDSYSSAPGVYKTNGSTAGTGLVKLTFQPGEGYPNAFPYFLARLGNALLFNALDPAHGRELWQTNGRETGTFMVADIDPSVTDYGYGYTYPNSGSPGFMVRWRNDLYFPATTRTEGQELWKMNVQSREPELVKDIRLGFEDYGYPDPYPKSSNPSGFTQLGNALYFSATGDESGSRRGLWKTDGTEAGTVLVKEMCGEGESCWVGQIVRLGNKLIFSASDPVHGYELWVSNGTASGTRLLKDLWPGTTQEPWGEYPNSSSPSSFVVLDDRVLFTASTAEHGGGELWRTDGTASGTRLVKDVNPGTAGGNAGGLKLICDRVYFSASEPGTGRELWRTDGTASGTRLVQDINPGPSGSDPNGLIQAGDRLFFTASDARPFDNGHGRELWALPLD